MSRRLTVSNLVLISTPKASNHERGAIRGTKGIGDSLLPADQSGADPAQPERRAT